MIASGEPSAVSWLYYANRLIELPTGVVGIAIGAVLIPTFTRAVQSGNRAAISAAQSRGLELAFGLALPAAIALALLAVPIVRTLFEYGKFTSADTTATASALVALALGLPGHVLMRVLSAAFFAREDTKTPMIAALMGLVIGLVGGLALMPWLGHVGVAIAASASTWAGAAILVIQIVRRIGFSLDREARHHLPRIFIAALMMGVVLIALSVLLEPWLRAEAASINRLLGLIGLVASGLAAYGLLLQLFGVVRLRDLAGATGPAPLA
jgi:putative peptidoglycan lipid II flippase